MQEHRDRATWGATLAPCAFLAPAVLIVAGVLVYPLGYALYFSMTDKVMAVSTFSFVGMDNYVRLTGDPVFWKAFRHSVGFTAVAGTLNLTLGFSLALALNRRFRLRGLFRTALLLPWVFPPIVTGLVFRWLYNDFYGYLNCLLLRLQLIDQPILFLVDPRFVWPSVVAANVWVEYPFVMLMFMAALQAIDSDLYRAARVDGAGAWQRFVHITLPAMKPVILINALLQVIFMFKTFNIVWIITRGGPGNQTELLSTLAFRYGFESTQTGYGSAVAAIIFYALLALSTLYVYMTAHRGALS